MYSSVPVLPKRFRHYEKIIGEEAANEIRELAAPLKGARVLHLNATAFGGGVAELLGTMVPLMKDLGLNADWQVMHGTDRFFTVTKALHNSLQGAAQWSIQRANLWRKYQKQNAEDWDEDFDFVVIHDPQPAGIPHYLEEDGRPLKCGLTWRCHNDLTNALP
jgi:trehalose synthase